MPTSKVMKYVTPDREVRKVFILQSFHKNEECIVAVTTSMEDTDRQQTKYADLQEGWEKALQRFTNHYQPKQELVNKYLYKIRKEAMVKPGAQPFTKADLQSIKAQILEQYKPAPEIVLDSDWEFFQDDNMRMVVCTLNLEPATKKTLAYLTKHHAISHYSYSAYFTNNFLKARAEKLKEYDEFVKNDFKLSIKVGNTEYQIWNRAIPEFCKRLKIKLD